MPFNLVNVKINVAFPFKSIKLESKEQNAIIGSYTSVVQSIK